MGLSHSVQETLALKLSPLQRDLLRMNKVAYVDVVNFLEILNSIMEDVCSHETSVITFNIINPQVENTVVWKLILRIRCLKTLKSTGEVQSKRILKLHQFIRLYDDMLYQLANLDLSRFTNELFLGSDPEMSFANVSMASSSSALDFPNECPICWDRPANVVLACSGAHAYCHECIKQWNRECPLCRGRSDIEADSWECVDMTDAVSVDEQSSLAVERNHVLIGLADKAGQPMS